MSSNTTNNKPKTVDDIVKAIQAAQSPNALTVRSGTIPKGGNADHLSLDGLSGINFISSADHSVVDTAPASVPLPSDKDDKAHPPAGTAAPSLLRASAPAPKKASPTATATTLEVLAGTSMSKIAAAAADHGFVLPISLKKKRSLGSALYRSLVKEKQILAKKKNESSATAALTQHDVAPSLLGGTLGSLTSFVRKLTVVSKSTGKVLAKEAVGEAEAGVNSILDFFDPKDHIITSAVLDAPRATEVFGLKKGMGFVIPYTREAAEELFALAERVAKGEEKGVLSAAKQISGEKRGREEEAPAGEQHDDNNDNATAAETDDGTPFLFEVFHGAYGVPSIRIRSDAAAYLFSKLMSNYTAASAAATEGEGKDDEAAAAADEDAKLTVASTPAGTLLKLAKASVSDAPDALKTITSALRAVSAPTKAAPSAIPTSVISELMSHLQMFSDDDARLDVQYNAKIDAPLSTAEATAAPAAADASATTSAHPFLFATAPRAATFLKSGITDIIKKMLDDFEAGVIGAITPVADFIKKGIKWLRYTTEYGFYYKFDPVTGVCDYNRKATCNNAWLDKVKNGNSKLIPNFLGKTITEADGELYTKATQQYGSSSVPADDCKPSAICYPTNEKDIVAVVDYAIKNSLKVVARSGGHQYCAKSSGKKGTVVVSLDVEPFQQIVRIVNREGTVSLGPGVKLFDITGANKILGVTVPHGECPFVCIGGHAQTGGYGHLLRCFGLCLDYIQQFDIVIADGGKPRLCTVSRPEINDLPFGSATPTDDALVKKGKISGDIDESVYTLLTEKENRDLFRCVLSGNAGSYGIVTKYYFVAIQDKNFYDEQNKEKQISKVYSNAFYYDKVTFTNLMNYVKAVSGAVAAGTDDNEGSPVAVNVVSGEGAGKSVPIVTKDVDFMMTVANKKFPFGKLLVAEAVSVNPAVNVNPFEALQACTEQAKVASLSITSKPQSAPVAKPLSAISRSFVRIPGQGTTLEGREQDMPYKKRLNATFEEVSEEFVEAFVDMCDEIIAEDKVALVFQMGLGGGYYKMGGRDLTKNGGAGGPPQKQEGAVRPSCCGEPLTGIPHRDYTFCFVFDIFYPDGCEEIANQHQNKMAEIVANHFNTKGRGETRMFWGSFDNKFTNPDLKIDETDMKETEVQQFYYGTLPENVQSYKRFQELKVKFDPTDVFHTNFTVQKKE